MAFSKSLAVLVLLAAASAASAQVVCDATNDCCLQLADLSYEFKANTEPCGEVPTEPCAVQATCDGAGTCGSVTAAVAGTVCSTATELSCELDAVCDGTLFTCPENPVQVAGTACGPEVDDCQVQPVCNGETATCPEPELKEVGTQCKFGTAFDDLPEECRTCQGEPSCPSASSNGACNPGNGKGKNGRRLASL